MFHAGWHGIQIAKEKKMDEANDFYLFLMRVKEGDEIFVETTESTFMASIGTTVRKAMNIDAIEIWQVIDGCESQVHRMSSFATDVINGALMLRGLQLSSPKFYNRQKCELKINADRLSDTYYPKRDRIYYIKFTVQEWKPPQS